MTRPGSLPDAIWAAWYQQQWWIPMFALIFVATPLVFPTGRLLSARWSPVAAVAALVIVALVLLAALQPTIKLQDQDYWVDNPIGVAGIPDPETSRVAGVLLGLLTACIVVAVICLVLRFRRSSGVERQQLKWVVYAGVLLLLTIPVGMFLPATLGDALWGLIIAFVPVAAGIAILRYRLFDIDRLINRTLVYGLLTAVLGLGYVGAVLVLGQVFGAVGRDPRAGRWPARPWPWRRCSTRPAAASRRSWIGASIVASTTPPGRSRPSAPACGTRSTWTRSQMSCWAWSTRPCSQRPLPYGSDQRHRPSRVVDDEEDGATPTRLDPLRAMQFRVALPLQVKDQQPA
jgi:hypothetical protein